jgi:hypothetical protein
VDLSALYTPLKIGLYLDNICEWEIQKEWILKFFFVLNFSADLEEINFAEILRNSLSALIFLQGKKDENFELKEPHISTADVRSAFVFFYLNISFFHFGGRSYMTSNIQFSVTEEELCLNISFDNWSLRFIEYLADHQWIKLDRIHDILFWSSCRTLRYPDLIDHSHCPLLGYPGGR